MHEGSRLWQLALNNTGRKIHKWAHYFPAYERHFSRFVDRPVTIFEIGCGEGGSLRLWKTFFGPFARIVGIDRLPECRDFEEEQIAVRIGEQSDLGLLARVAQEFGVPDIVIDDGSHRVADQRATFEFFYPRLDRNGVYAVEDVHTSYWTNYGGGRGDPASFIEFTKTLIDQLHGEWTLEPTDRTAFTRSTMSMHIYDSLIVFEKGVSPRPRALFSEAGRHEEKELPPLIPVRPGTL